MNLSAISICFTLQSDTGTGKKQLQNTLVDKPGQPDGCTRKVGAHKREFLLAMLQSQAWHGSQFEPYRLHVVESEHWLSVNLDQ